MYKSDINLNLYRIFYEVAKYENITKAAEKIYLSQSAISKAIKRLESELNTKLFIRNKGGVILTDKGKELLYFVEKSHNNLVIAERTMKETENLERGKLSIGMPSNVGTFYLFDKVIDFHNKYPNIEITIVTGGTSKLLSLLDSHEIDFVVDTFPIHDLKDGMEVKELLEVENCFVKKKNSKFNNIKTNKDLEKYPLILPIKGTENRNNLDLYLNKNNINVNNVLNIHTSEMILSFTKKDLGIGYLIKNLVDDELEILDIKGLPKTKIGIVYDKKYLTTAPRRFIQMYIL